MSKMLGIAAVVLAASSAVAIAAGGDKPAMVERDDKGGVKVEAPATRVETGKDGERRVKVEAPYTDVRVDADRVRVRAPFVDIDIPRR